MKNFTILVLFLFFSYESKAQVESDCTVSPELAIEYERDVKNLCLTRMYGQKSSDTAFVDIPQVVQDTIWEGLAAIFNATSIPQRDSIFNLYCIHDNTSFISTFNEILVKVDTNYAWTEAWQNLIALTGNNYIDSLVMEHSLEVTTFYNWSFGNYALIYTESYWNIYALIHELNKEEGVLSGEPNYIIGEAGKIKYRLEGDMRFYDFRFEFNDCFDGCDNYREWSFMVNRDCGVEYLGFEDFGFFGIEPLPEPINCNLFTSTKNPSIIALQVVPNPTSSIIRIEGFEDFEESSTCQIVDIHGRAYKEISSFVIGEQIDVSSLPSGIYFIQFKSLDRIPVKFIKY